MNTLKLSSKEAVEERLTEELSSMGKVTPGCHGFDWEYAGKKLFFRVEPVMFGKQEVPIIKMHSWTYHGSSKKELHKNFPRFAKEIANLDDIISKYNLGLECTLRYEPYWGKPMDIIEDDNIFGGARPLRFIEIADIAPDPSLHHYNIRKVGGLITESLLQDHRVWLETSRTAFTADEIIPAVYSQKEYIELCTKSP